MVYTGNPHRRILAHAPNLRNPATNADRTAYYAPMAGRRPRHGAIAALAIKTPRRTTGRSRNRCRPSRNRLCRRQNCQLRKPDRLMVYRFRSDHKFIRVHHPESAFDKNGPIHRRGVCIPGLFFVGLKFQHTVGSHLLRGVGTRRGIHRTENRRKEPSQCLVNKTTPSAWA